MQVLKLGVSIRTRVYTRSADIGGGGLRSEPCLCGDPYCSWCGHGIQRCVICGLEVEDCPHYDEEGNRKSEFVSQFAAAEKAESEAEAAWANLDAEMDLDAYVPSIHVACTDCGVDYDEQEVTALNIEEGLQGEDILTFRCPNGHETKGVRR